MEIKYTLEILTKDIQDIGKLVANLQNSPEGSKLELDLALSKLRNVYDILTVIREDISHPSQPLLQSAAQSPVAPPAKAPAKPPEETLAETPTETPSEAPTEAPSQAPEAAPPQPPVVEAPKPEPEPVPEPVVEKPRAKAEPEPVVKPQPEPVVETSKAEPAPVADTPAQEPEPEKKAKTEPSTEKEQTIIAEKFATESSINENLAGNRESGVDSKLLGQPIDQIGRHIGINDRFLIIRELFDGDSDGFGKLIQDLDSAGNLQSASDRLLSQFGNAPEHEGVDILDKLVKRKYSQS